MTTIPRDTAYRQLVTQHRTMLWQTSTGRLSLRKDAGRFIVRLEDYDLAKTTKKSFATLPGALVAAENLKEYYL